MTWTLFSDEGVRLEHGHCGLTVVYICDVDIVLWLRFTPETWAKQCQNGLHLERGHCSLSRVYVSVMGKAI